MTVDLAPLRARAESMLGAADPAGQLAPGQRVDKIRGATRALLTLLAEEEDPEVLGQLAADLSRLQSRLKDGYYNAGWLPLTLRWYPAEELLGLPWPK